MTQKFSFRNDYSEGAHPSILSELQSTNLAQQQGYGDDEYSRTAASLIKNAIDNESAAIHLVPGGTHTNLIALASLLNPFQSVIAANSAHIAVHEAGAIEATGHKINTVVSSDGKLTREHIVAVVNEHQDEHMVQPKVVFVSNSTEVGTIYSKRELEAISTVCKEHALYLYLDGARLGSALTAKGNDLTLKDIAKLCDMFYIGGTKNGALYGEALVVSSAHLQKDFRRHLKQRGALLAKGWLLGLQFQALFTDNLYFELARHANEMAGILAKGIEDLGYEFLTDSATNQIFPILPNEVISKLEKDYGFYVWSKIDSNRSAIRLVTSWATPEEKVQVFLKDIAKLKE